LGVGIEPGAALLDFLLGGSKHGGQHQPLRVAQLGLPLELADLPVQVVN
jgi:hypothetical protein